VPYITEARRKAIGEGANIKTAGELNYVFTAMSLEYLETGTNYQKINDILGALEGCKLEMYRRLAAPYEDTKIKENGDVYGTDA
jgi:hypothetical protein